jgi:hypothetical protein
MVLNPNIVQELYAIGQFCLLTKSKVFARMDDRLLARLSLGQRLGPEFPSDGLIVLRILRLAFTSVRNCQVDCDQQYIVSIGS